MEDITLLLVDPDQLTLTGLSEPFSRDGYRVISTSNGTAAFEQIEVDSFAVVITELVLPDMSGLDLLKFVKAKDSSTMVIVLTGYGDPDSIISALRLDADDYIIKPVRYRDLQFRIRRVLDKQQLLWQNKVLRREVAERNRELIKLNRDLLWEIEEREAAEKQIRRALDEKEVLLREIHHRVKNNLAMIASLINLKSKQQSEPAVQLVFNELKQRIRAIQLVHEKIYRGNEITSINYSDYLEELLRGLISTLDPTDGRVSFQLESDAILLNLDTSIPLGLAVTELVSNSIKHAFNGEGEGKIRVSFHRKGDSFELDYEDSGPGIPEEAVEGTVTSGTLGLKLVSALARQLGGSMERKHEGAVLIKFPCAGI